MTGTSGQPSPPDGNGRNPMHVVDLRKTGNAQRKPDGESK